MAAALTTYLKRDVSTRKAAAPANAFGVLAVRDGATIPVEHLLGQAKTTLVGALVGTLT
jgi:hypothetical protein